MEKAAQLQPNKPRQYSYFIYKQNSFPEGYKMDEPPPKSRVMWHAAQGTEEQKQN